MLMSQGAWAAFQYETTTYDFESAAQGSAPSITMGASYSGIGITAGQYALTMTADGTTTTDISKLAFRYTGPIGGGKERGWYLRVKDNNKGLFCTGTNYTPQLAICDLHAGDKVTITYTSSQSITYTSGAHIYSDSHETNNIVSGAVYTLAQDGDLIIQANDGSTYIQTIKIEELTSVATYSITSNVNSNGVKENKFEFTGEGRLMDTHISIPFLNVEFGSDLNATFVHSIGDGKYGSYIPDEKGYWHTWFGEKAPFQGTFYKFKPTADGKLQVKGNLESGTVHLFEVVNEEEGYYESLGTSSGTGYVTVVDGKWVDLKKGKTYYICEHRWEQGNNGGRYNNNFQLHWFQFNNYFDVPELGKVLENGATGGELVTVKTDGQPGGTLTGWSVKRTSPNIKNQEESSNLQVTCTNGVVSISGIEYKDENKDKAGVMILDLNFSGGDATFVVTIPYSAKKGHIWNFSDTSKSDSKGTNTDGLLEIGRYADTGSTLHNETQTGAWKFTHRVINQSGQGTHDPMFKNTRDMDGNNAAMIWETEGLWFTTPSNKSCIYNESMGTETFTVTLKDSKGNTRYNSDKTPMTEERRSDPDRYVGILPGGKFTIPGLKEGDRVIIFMGSGDGSNADVCFFNISNAKDAIGQDITETDVYKAGGSLWNVDNNGYNGHNDPNYRGCYHFIAQDDGPMTFEMVGGSMCKLYSIEIYRGERINTNSVQEGAKGSGYTLLATKDGGAGETKTWNLHYRGKGETLADGIERNGKTIKNEFIAWSGTITKENTPLTTNSNTISCTNNGVIGMARVRAKCMEYNQKYVTDFADRNLTFAYHEKAPGYPYTWDFTDINGVSSSAITGEYNNYNELQSGDDGYEFEPKGRELSMWDANGKMVIYCSDGSYYQNQNMIFENAKGINGNQLYANGAVIPETKGLWFYFDNNDPAYNGCMQIAADGLHLANTKKMMEDGTTNLTMGWWNYKMVIPDVPAGAAVYLRMQRDPSVADGDFSKKPNEDPVYFLNTSYHFGVSSTSSPKTNLTPVNSSSFDLSKQEDVYNATGNSNSKYSFYKVNGKTDEWIACVKNTTGAVNNLTFTLNGWTLKKLAVSEDWKKVNVKGWTTESRTRVIDPALTGYMTGKDMRTYIVTGVEYSKTKKQATLTRIDTDPSDNPKFKDGCLMPIASDGDNNACIILNCTSDGKDGLAGAEANILDGGFHLFVPDMYDYNFTQNTEGVKKFWASHGITSLMKSQVSSTNGQKTIPATEGNYTNYAFTCKYYDIDPETGQKVNSDQALQTGIQAFYRIVNKASSTGNQGYLPILIEEKTNNNNEGGETNSSRAASPARVSSPERFSIVFNNLSDVSLQEGDVNGDGYFNKLDVNTIADRLAGRPTAKFFTGVADMNNDGKIDIVDMTLMIKNITSE